MIQSFLEGIGESQSLLIFGTEMLVDLPEIVSSCRSLQSGGQDMIQRDIIGPKLIQTAQEAINLLNVSFKIPDALAEHITSVPFQQCFPLRRRFFALMVILWDKLLENIGKRM